jgi:hypothetical protein
MMVLRFADQDAVTASDPPHSSDVHSMVRGLESALLSHRRKESCPRANRAGR